MTSGHIGSSRDNRRRWTTLALVAGCLSLSACASMAKVSTDATTIWQTHIVRPVRYRLAGVDPDVRANLSRGQRELQAKNYPGALATLNRDVWDVGGIERRSLRLTELGDVYDALRRAYTGLGMPKRAAEHQRMAIALTEASARDQAAGTSEGSGAGASRLTSAAGTRGSAGEGSVRGSRWSTAAMSPSSTSRRSVTACGGARRLDPGFHPPASSIESQRWARCSSSRTG